MTAHLPDCGDTACFYQSASGEPRAASLPDCGDAAFLYPSASGEPRAVLRLARGQSIRPTHAEVEAAFGRAFDWESPCLSLSHSGGYFCLLEADLPCGVDLEVRRPLRSGVAARIFPGFEGDFFRLWTRKEAAAKLLSHEGEGITLMSVPRISLEGLSLVTFSRSDFALSLATRRPVSLSLIIKGRI